MTTKLYHHKTNGGAEYLCTSPVEGTDEGDLHTAIIRLDGGPELLNPVNTLELLQTLEDLIGMCNMPEVRQAMKHNQAYYHGTMRAANHAVYKAKNG